MALIIDTRNDQTVAHAEKMLGKAKLKQTHM